MAEIDVSGLKAKASAVIGDVERCVAYVVTKRGRPAAVLLPVEDADDLVLADATPTSGCVETRGLPMRRSLDGSGRARRRTRTFLTPHGFRVTADYGPGHLLQRREGKTLDFKRDLSSPTGVIKTVVAFANTAGGEVVVGVDDHRNVVGVADPLDDEERLASLIADRIHPIVIADIEIVPWRSTNVLVAHVPGSPLRPHHVASEGPEVGVYVRLGSTSRRADPAMVEELSDIA